MDCGVDSHAREGAADDAAGEPEELDLVVSLCFGDGERGLGVGNLEGGLK